MSTFLKIVMAAGATVGALVTAGVLPASFAVVGAVAGAIAGVLHPSPAAISAFGQSAK